MKTGTLRSEIRWLRRQSILNYKETLVFGIPLTRELQQSIRWNIVSGFSSCKSMSSAGRSWRKKAAADQKGVPRVEIPLFV